ncbi:MAG: 50S ribosomal protein L11 methyltransferase [Saprospiraceae bacterium]
MNYWQYHIITEPRYIEILQAFLAELPFDTFEDTENGFNAYLPVQAATDNLEAQLIDIQSQFPFKYEKTEIAHRNWNAEWEANFQPVKVGNFCGIRADFHPQMLDVKYEIIINPKMAFGTGHHETTYMMINAMRELAFKGTKILDYGTGTGILAILASKLGAAMIDAVDIEREAYDNTLENAQINNIDNIQVYHGTLDNILDSGYDIILANINRNIILDSLPVLAEKIKRNGVLLISGILKEDAPIMETFADDFRFTVDERYYRGNWACLKLLK